MPNQSLQFIGKAGTLQQLQYTIKHAKVLPQLQFSLADWQAAGCRWGPLDLQAEWLAQPVIVRSSAYLEDHLQHSLAGRYHSVENVQGDVAIETAVNRIIDSFEDSNPEHKIFIQPMVEDIHISGVALTYEPSHASPYYMIGFDNDTQCGSAVTHGYSKQLQLLYVARSSLVQLNGWQMRLLSLLKELETLFQNNALDIEFIVTTKHQIILLQVRPLVLNNPIKLHQNEQGKVLKEIKAYLQTAYTENRSTLWSVMSDWNPAEIIGLRPKPLALSLYRQLITNRVWAEQRHEYGYQDMRGTPLMHDISGIPYIDLRASFNSFIPQSIPSELATRICCFYEEKLKKNPQYHDKIEFDIVYSCDHFNLSKDLNTTLDNCFSNTDKHLLQQTLNQLTRSIIAPRTGLWLSDTEAINQLPAQHKTIWESKLNHKDKLKALLENCQQKGARPFAGLARTAFIAMQLLQSMVQQGIFSINDKNHFMQSINTVSSQLQQARQTLTRKQFLKQYGYMRQGMYNLLSPRYDELDDDLLFGYQSPYKQSIRNFKLNSLQKKQLEQRLTQHQYEYTPSEFIAFIRTAIEAREYAKYAFSHAVSDILKLCQTIGQTHQFSIQQTAFLTINQIAHLEATSILKQHIQKARARHAITQALILPPIITNASTTEHFQMPPQQPSFITLKQTTASLINLDKVLHLNTENLKNKVILLKAADPGYDWLFTHNIAGLITLYGGANSHMAIRAAEMGLPAALGIGEILYQQLSKAQIITLDCENQALYPLP